jgi:hypothetical protein
LELAVKMAYQKKNEESPEPSIPKLETIEE